jgi:hypothetical protein
MEELSECREKAVTVGEKLSRDSGWRNSSEVNWFAFPDFKMKGVPVLRLTFSNPTPIIRRWHDLMPFGA